MSDELGSDGDPEALAELLRLQAQARQVLQRIREVHGELARWGEPEGDTERELLRLIRERDALAGALGLEILRLLSSGVELSWSGKGAPAPEPEDRAEGGAVTSGPRHAPEVRRTPGPPPVRERSAAPAAPGRVDPILLKALLSRLDRPRAIRTRRDAAEEVAQISATVAERDAWLAQPRTVQQAMVGLVSSRARHLQDESGIGLEHEASELLRSAFSEMTAWSREHQPGFVPGLSRHNDPKGESWLYDAQQWWLALDAYLPKPSPAEAASDALAQLQRAMADEPSRKQLRVWVRKAVQAGLAPDDPRLVQALLPRHEDLIGMRGLNELKDALRRALDGDDGAQG